MAGKAAKALAMLAGAGALASLGYTAFAIERVREFRRRASQAPQPAAIPITVIKPLFGDEPQLAENLDSFCNQQYAEYQVIFVAADAADPALDVAREIAARHADRDIQIVAGHSQRAPNPKIANVLGAIDLAKHPVIVIADSDIRVGPNYANAVASCFSDPGVGAATCIYGGIPRDSTASLLGAMQINDQFAPSVMVASALEPLTYCFGATMAVRRDALERIGGLPAIADRLADDYLLGKLVAQAGYRVALAAHPVQTTVADDSLAALWQHELRWACAIFGQRPAGYAGSVLTYSLPFAALFALAARTPFACVTLAAAAALRVLLHEEGRRTFAPGSPFTPRLIPLRDAFGVAVWAAGFFGKRVRWRSEAYSLDAGGRMAPGPGEV